MTAPPNAPSSPSHNPLYRYTFAHFPRPTIFYILHYNDLPLFLDFPHMHALSATVRHDLAHEFIPPSEYSLYTHTTPAHRRLIRHFTPHLRPHDLGAFRWSVVQAFVLFIHASPLRETEGCGLRTERQWLQLGALAQVFGIPALFDYAAEGLAAAVERKSKKRKRRRALWEVVGRLRKMMERDPWRGLEDELCSG